MNTKQSIIAGAVLAGFLVTGPIAWRATQIHQAEKSLVAVSPIPTARNTEKSAAEVAGLPPSPEKTKSARDRLTTPLSGADRNNMIAAIPQILEENVKATLSEWFERDAWLEARNTATTLGLSDTIETELRQFLVSEHTKQTADLGAGLEIGDKAARRREGDTRRDAWFASRLNPQQMESLQNFKKTKNVALAEKLAASAIRQMNENINLTADQKSQLHDAAFAKATRSVKERNYFNKVGFGVALNKGDEEPIEEKSEDFVRSILNPDQQKLWSVTLERDRAFSINMQKGIVGGIIQQLKKVQPTAEELRKLGN